MSRWRFPTDMFTRQRQVIILALNAADDDVVSGAQGNGRQDGRCGHLPSDERALHHGPTAKGVHIMIILLVACIINHLARLQAPSC